MELPQSRSYGATQGGKPTHDFLSLYTHSSLQQDPRPSQGEFLKTHNFLPPVGGEQNGAKEDNSIEMNDKPPPVAPSTSVVEHLLPGGFGTYTTTNLLNFTTKPLKTEENVLPVASATSNDRNDDNSNSSSYNGSGFTLWDESATRKGHAGKDYFGDANTAKEPLTRVGQWPLDWPSQSSSTLNSSVSPLSSSQAQPLGPKNQSFMEMLKSAKGPCSMDEEDEEHLSIKKESSSSQRGELRVKIDGKNTDRDANTPRSKHSATEQRRRCKINDRFQMLRELIPHSDQKRDKASFLLEVIEYIQFLQEKVTRYEGPYPGWNGDPNKLNPWRNGQGATDNFADRPRVANGVSNPLLMFGEKFDEKATSVPNILRNSQTQAECSVANSFSFKGVDQHSGLATKTGSLSQTLQPDVYAPVRNSCAVAQRLARIVSDAGKATLPQLQLQQSTTFECVRAAATAELKDQELPLDGGTINVSSIYSQGLLNTLTKALRNSGVDLSQASISVQVDIGKRSNKGQSGPDPTEGKNADVICNSRPLLRGRVESSSYESDHDVKRLKTG